MDDMDSKAIDILLKRVSELEKQVECLMQVAEEHTKLIREWKNLYEPVVVTRVIREGGGKN